MGIIEFLRNILMGIIEFLFGSTPEVPELSTAEFVREWLEEVFGLTMDGEDEIFQTSIPHIKEVNKYGYLGAPISTVIDGVEMCVGFVAMAECNVITEYEETDMTEENCDKRFGKWKDGKCMRAKSGHGKFRFEFDPNNGFVYYLSIHPDFVTEETKDLVMEDRLPFTANPDFETYLQPRK
jgi:hypothetical protein